MFKDKVVIVTGGTKGIGKEISKKFLTENAIVIINYSADDETANKTFDELQSISKKIELIKADISISNEAIRMVKNVEKKWGNVDILVNNAGINNDKLFLSATNKDMYRIMNVNFWGVINCSQAVLKGMIRKGEGNIVNISSLSAIDGRMGQSIYASSKAAVIAFTRVLAKEVGRWNIRVNALVPGIVESNMTADMLNKNKDVELNSIPLQRFGQAKDVAGVVAFVCSEEAGYITGSQIVIDGGSSL